MTKTPDIGKKEKGDSCVFKGSRARKKKTRCLDCVVVLAKNLLNRKHQVPRNIASHSCGLLAESKILFFV